MISLNESAIITCIEEKVSDLQGIYLFGSYALGYATEKSDIDIAVLCKKKILYDLKSSLCLALSDLTLKQIDLIELRYINTIFQAEILNTAKKIATFDETGCAAYEDFIYSSAMDFREFRKEHVAEIIKRGSVYG